MRLSANAGSRPATRHALPAAWWTMETRSSVGHVCFDLRTERSAPGITGAVDKVLDLHLFKFAAPKDKISWRDLISKRLANLRYTVRNAEAPLPVEPIVMKVCVNN